MSAGDVIRGRYRLDRRLGAGTFGTVFKAKDLTTDQTVAVKVANVSVRRANFEREVQSYREISSTPTCQQYVVCLFDAFVDGNTGYEVMELMDGDLHAKALQPGDQINMMRDLLAGLAFIHSKGYAHQDIKPANVLSKGGVYKMGDLGAVCLSQPQGFIQACTVYGTPQYMAPELPTSKANQRIPLDVAQRADIWSLGVTFFEVITGARPYIEGSNNTGVMQQSQVAPLNQGISYGLVSAMFVNMLVNSMLQVDPSKRPTAKQLLDAITGELEGCITGEGRRINRSELLASLQRIGVQPPIDAPLATLCKTLNDALSITCNVKGGTYNLDALRQLASIFQVSARPDQLCAKVTEVVTQQGKIDRRRLAQTIYNALIQAAKLRLEGKIPDAEVIERQVVEVADLVASVDGIDIEYLAAQYGFTVVMLKQTPVTPQTAATIDLAKMTIQVFDAFTGTSQWRELLTRRVKA